MDLTPYVDGLHRELLASAGAGDGEAMALAERLAASVASATRLTMLDVLSAAADEITRDLVPGSVEIRLRGRNPHFVVTSPSFHEALDDDLEPPEDAPAPEEALPAPSGTEGAVGRINFRPPEQLKDSKRTRMQVHGRTGEACPVCGDTVREVIFADSTFQYCPTCQTGGKPLADRVLSRLLK